MAKLQEHGIGVMFLSYLYTMIRRLNKKRIIIMILILLVNASWLGWYIYNQKESIQSEPSVKLYLHNKNSVIDINLEQYIKGTLAAEMPASFEMEALKAQAVCARTYAIKKLTANSVYPQGADLSDDINSCQAFIAMQDYAIENPMRTEFLKRIDEAVESTRGEIIIFNSQPIDALYCSTCGGRTEDAQEVWGTAINYLQSVKCGYCNKSSHYKEAITFSNTEIIQAAGSTGSRLSIKIIGRTRGGRPQKLSINGQQVDAITFRKALNLPSTWMEFESASLSTTIIHTHGYGHGVGLCQYGANGMAQSGKNYHQILKKYYKGVSFYKMTY